RRLQRTRRAHAQPRRERAWQHLRPALLSRRNNQRLKKISAAVFNPRRLFSEVRTVRQVTRLKRKENHSTARVMSPRLRHFSKSILLQAAVSRSNICVSWAAKSRS